MPSFLIEYHRKSRDLKVSAFDNSKDAMARRFELERGRDDEHVEIVVVTAPSIGVLRRTHSRYFASTQTVQATGCSVDETVCRRRAPRPGRHVDPS